MMVQIKICPIDTWFFGDGRPFNQDDSGLTETRSVFPPDPHVVVSALRAFFGNLLQNGGDWNETTKQEIGDGLWDLGKLTFSRLRVVNSDQKTLIPAPLALSRPSEGKKPWSISPVKDTGYGNDLGLQRGFEDPNPAKHSSPQNSFIEEEFWKSGIRAFDRELLPAVTVSERMAIDHNDRKPRQTTYVAAMAPRVGIQLAHSYKTVVKGMLYAAAHVALSEDCHLSIDVHIPDGLKLSKEIELLSKENVLNSIPFGGLGKAASIEVSVINPLPTQSLPASKKMVLATLVTPALLEGKTISALGVGSNLFGSNDHEIQAVVMDRISRFGGWDRGRGRTWCWSIPAGTTLLIGTSNIADLTAKFKQFGLNFCTSPTSEAARASAFGEVVLTEWSND